MDKSSSAPSNPSSIILYLLSKQLYFSYGSLGCKPTTPLCRFSSVFVGILSVFPRLQKPTEVFWETGKFIGFRRFLSVFLSVLGPHFMVFSLNFPKSYLTRNFFCKVNWRLFHLDTFFVMIVESKTKMQGKPYFKSF